MKTIKSLALTALLAFTNSTLTSAAPAGVPARQDLLAAQAAKGRDGDPVENVVRQNVREVVARLKMWAPVLAPLFKAGELEIVGARYDHDDGKVEIVP